VQRIISEPDILFSAADLCWQIMDIERTDTSRWWNSAAFNAQTNQTDRIIVPPIKVTSTGAVQSCKHMTSIPTHLCVRAEVEFESIVVGNRLFRKDHISSATNCPVHFQIWQPKGQIRKGP